MSTFGTVDPYVKTVEVGAANGVPALDASGNIVISSTPVAVANLASGGSIGSAATTVDIASYITLNQTTASQTVTIPTPTVITAGKKVVITNIGSAAVTILAISVGAGVSIQAIFTGNAWSYVL